MLGRRGFSASCRRPCTGQFAVRTSIFLLVLLATDAGFEFVLGAFAAGIVVGLALDSPEGDVVRLRLEGIGFGFLIPIYFVVTGMNFDIDSLLTISGIALAVLFLALLFVARGHRRSCGFASSDGGMPSLSRCSARPDFR